MNYSNQTIEELIASTQAGQEGAGAALFASLYTELHRLAKRELSRSGVRATLSATTLLHEAYLDFCGRERPFLDQPRFMGYAARVMRGLIIDYARRQHALKRGGGFEITSVALEVGDPIVDAASLSAVGDAMEDLAKVDPGLAQLVDLKFFCGLSFAEIAVTCDISERTAQRNWEKARMYLHRAIKGS
jgi:RNA polymerase sigma factor (TIGR02999 family)